MIQMMRGYVDNRQERNGQSGTGWHRLYGANGPGWQSPCGVHAEGKSSGEVCRTSPEDTR